MDDEDEASSLIYRKTKLLVKVTFTPLVTVPVGPTTAVELRRKRRNFSQRRGSSNCYQVLDVRDGVIQDIIEDLLKIIFIHRLCFLFRLKFLNSLLYLYLFLYVCLFGCIVIFLCLLLFLQLFVYFMLILSLARPVGTAVFNGVVES